MDISEGVIRQGPNNLGDLHYSSDDSQPHSIIAKYPPPLDSLFRGYLFFLVLGGGEAGRGERMTYILTLQSKNIKMDPLTKFLRLIIQSTQLYHVT